MSHRTPSSPTLTRPLPVAFCITELDPGGAERALVETVTRLDRERWTPAVYCLGPEAVLSERLRNESIEVIAYSASSGQAISTIRKLRHDLKESRPLALLCSLFHANIVGRIAAAGLSIPVVAGHRVAERRARWHLTLERLTGHLVTHHVAVSESVRSFLIANRIARPGNSSVVYNGVDVDRFARAEPAAVDVPGPVVLFAGRLDAQKGVEILFESWPHVAAKWPNATLLLAGDGPLRADVEGRVGRNGVRYIGYQPDLAPWYRCADVVVLPSRWEGLPNVLLESLASGTPCVISDVEGVREVFGDRDTTIVPPGDAAALAVAIERVLGDLASATKLAVELQSIVQKKFTWDRSAQLIDQLICDVADVS